MSLLCIMVPVCCMYSLRCKLDLPVVIDFMYLTMILPLVKLFFLFCLFSVCCGQSRCRCRKGFRIKVGHLSQNYITILIRISNWPNTGQKHRASNNTHHPLQFFLLVECPYASHCDHKSQPKNYFKYILNK